MARWKLRAPHYLSVPGTEYEYKETDRTSGKQVRIVHKVPRLLDPKDPGDWTHKGDEAIIVCHGKSSDPRDLEFLGDPTPDMDPMDDEAREISSRFSWKPPVDGDESVSFGEGLIERFLAQQAEVMVKQSQNAPQPVSAGMVGMDKFIELQERMAQLMEQQTKILGMVLESKAPAPAQQARRPS